MSKARDLADLAKNANDRLDTVATSDGALSNRNLIINGAMQVAQRGTSATGLSTIGLNTVDRFSGNSSSVGSFAHTDEQVSDAPSGFLNSRKITVTTAQTTGSSTRNQVRHHVEGLNSSFLNWGTADAKTVTLSFWVKSSVTGAMAVSFINQTETHSFVSDYTVNSANTWEYKTIVVEGPTVGTWSTGTSIGIRIAWDLGSGSTYQTSTSDAWVSGWYYRTSSSVRPMETLNATWQITGVQLEVGPEATPFEHRSYGDELARCQRYYYRWGYTDATGGLGTIPLQCYATGSSGIDAWQNNPTEMRARPSISVNGTWVSSNVSSYSGRFQNRQGFSVRYNLHANGNAYIHAGTSDDYFEIDAEL